MSSPSECGAGILPVIPRDLIHSYPFLWLSEGARLSDGEVEQLLQGLEIRSFRSRDEQEVAGYAALMDLVYESSSEIDLTENHLLQLHGVLLRYSERDQRHRGHYKTIPTRVKAFDEAGRSVGVVAETASPLETPGRTRELLAWTLRKQKDVLGRKVEEERLMAPLAPLSEQLLGIVRDHGRVTVRQAVALTGANRNTIKHHLRQLVAAGHFVQHGRGRGTWYEKA